MLLIGFYALCVLSLIVSGIALQLSLRQVRDERDFRQILMHLSELEDNHEALLASHKRLRSRIGMRDLRSKRKNGEDTSFDDDLPDSTQQPEEWKRQMRLKLRK